MPSPGLAYRNMASEVSDHKSHALSSHTTGFAFSYIPAPEAPFPPIRASPQLAHSFHITTRWLLAPQSYPWLLFLSLLLPPASPCFGSSVGSLALVISPPFAHNFQAVILLLGQKQARFVLWALPTQAPGACCCLRHASPLCTCTHSSPPLRLLQEKSRTC